MRKKERHSITNNEPQQSLEKKRNMLGRTVRGCLVGGVRLLLALCCFSTTYAFFQVLSLLWTASPITIQDQAGVLNGAQLQPDAGKQMYTFDITTGNYEQNEHDLNTQVMQEPIDENTVHLVIDRSHRY